MFALYLPVLMACAVYFGSVLAGPFRSAKDSIPLKIQEKTGITCSILLEGQGELLSSCGKAWDFSFKKYSDVIGGENNEKSARKISVFSSQVNANNADKVAFCSPIFTFSPFYFHQICSLLIHHQT